MFFTDKDDDGLLYLLPAPKACTFGMSTTSTIVRVNKRRVDVANAISA